MINLNEIVEYCDTKLNIKEIKDFKNAFNGLQFSNNGKINKIGASVESGYHSCKKSIEKGVDFLIVHHGLFWNNHKPITNILYKKYKTIIDGNLAIYSSHLPLDCNQNIGNNIIISRKLELQVIDRFLNFEGNDIAIISNGINKRKILKSKISNLFLGKIKSLEYGTKNIKRIGISSGSGDSAIQHLLENNIDTLITGELRQSQFIIIQEAKINVYICGHYYTETFGVCALAKELSDNFHLPWEFISNPCLL